MAKRAKSSINKSQAIREYKAANSTAGPSEIAEALNKTGLKVSAQFVSTVLSNSKRKHGAVAKRGRKPGRSVASADMQQLVQAKKLVDKLGGIDAARSAVNALAQLLG